MNERTAIEAALVRDSVWLIAALVIIVAISWAWIIPMAIDMYGGMSGSARWMMPAHWQLQHDALLFAMWLVMMLGMMLPSAAPTLLIYAAVTRRSDVASRGWLSKFSLTTSTDGVASYYDGDGQFNLSKRC